MKRQVNVLREAATAALSCVQYYSDKQITVEEIEAALRPLIGDASADSAGYHAIVRANEQRRDEEESE